MFRYLIVGGTLFAFTISLIVWITRADLIDKDVKKPVTEWNATREAKIWQTAKDEAWKEWAGQIHLAPDCGNPRTELRKLECKNQWQLHAETFERTSADKVRSGWKPAGVF